MSSIRLVALCSAFGLLVACGGSAGGDGKSSITSLSQEPAGKDCPAGGTRVSAGTDADGNGVLDPNEVTSSQVVCGAAGGAKAEAAALTAVEAEPAGANCKAGGVRIKTGKDANANGTLDVAEVLGTKYVCNGEAPKAGTDVVTAYDPGMVSSGGLVTVLKATIKAPARGKVIAIANMDIFCASPALGQGYDCSAGGVTDGWWTMARAADALPDTGSYDYFYVSPNSTENAARTAIFDVAAAGDFDVYIRAQNNVGAMGFFRRSLTLMFVPG